MTFQHGTKRSVSRVIDSTLWCWSPQSNVGLKHAAASEAGEQVFVAVVWLTDCFHRRCSSLRRVSYRFDLGRPCVGIS
ncbi:hypothetical protein NPIL_162481 [Nephila pilipes]|uniref:Uncharacterized protein n=1 Tax=Nephila pilipes TaxID=299642 RepID=A0A8X6PES5_NEPPI|nr:hypothetical protein NPIL_162481 [Nephila pilipes]